MVTWFTSSSLEVITLLLQANLIYAPSATFANSDSKLDMCVSKQLNFLEILPEFALIMIQSLTKAFLLLNY